MALGYRMAVADMVPPKWDAICLVHWNGVDEAYAHADGIMVGHVRPAPGIQSSELFEFFQLLFHGQRRESVLHQQLGECSGGRSFRRAAIVGGQINNQGIVQLAHFLDMVDDPSDVIIDMFQKSGIDLHLP